MILKRLLWKYSVNRIHLAQDRDQWWAVTNTVMELQVPLKVVNLVNSLATINVSKYSYFYQPYLLWMHWCSFRGTNAVEV